MCLCHSTQEVGDDAQILSLALDATLLRMPILICDHDGDERRVVGEVMGLKSDLLPKQLAQAKEGLLANETTIHCEGFPGQDLLNSVLNCGSGHVWKEPLLQAIWRHDIDVCTLAELEAQKPQRFLGLGLKNSCLNEVSRRLGSEPIVQYKALPFVLGVCPQNQIGRKA